MSNIKKMNMLPNNVNIKIEPGTSRFGNIIHNNINIKIEPGISDRLASLKSPRDLKLSGSKQKVFKPNLNVVRKKKNDIVQPQANNNSPRGGRGRRNADRGRGSSRGKHSQNTVQSYGVFSEGIADSIRKNSHVFDKGERNFDSSKMLDRPTFNKNVEWKYDKKHEEEVLNNLLEVKPEDMELEPDLLPVTLPVMDKIDRKPVTLIENFIKSEDVPKEKISKDKFSFDSQEKLLLLQFPNALPGIGYTVDTEQPKPNATTTNNDSTVESNKTETENRCCLQDINEGLLGKILFYKSGKTKMLIGNFKFDLEIGPDSGFLQDVMSVPLNTATNTGDMINLGSLQGNVLVTPDWPELLKTD